MSREVNRRPYDGSRRRAGSERTRQRIVEAAGALFVERGYRATSIAAIADRAEVHVDTVYALVGRKPVLLTELIEQAISDEEHPVVAEERPYVRELRAEPDPARKLAIYAAAIRRIHERLAPLFVVLRDASSTEPEAQQVWERISQRRATNMRRFVLELRDAGGLRADLDPDEAADTVWVTNSPELYVMLTVERGWPPERYERWLCETWSRLLLP